MIFFTHSIIQVPYTVSVLAPTAYILHQVASTPPTFLLSKPVRGLLSFQSMDKIIMSVRSALALTVIILLLPVMIDLFDCGRLGDRRWFESSPGMKGKSVVWIFLAMERCLRRDLRIARSDYGRQRQVKSCTGSALIVISQVLPYPLVADLWLEERLGETCRCGVRRLGSSSNKSRGIETVYTMLLSLSQVQKSCLPHLIRQ